MLLALSACHTPGLRPEPGQEKIWSGRLMLQVHSGVQTQTTHLQFECTGSVPQGQLHVLSPLGNLVAQVHWSSQGAWLQTRAFDTSAPGSSDLAQARRFTHLEALMQQTLGVAVPVPAIMAWVHEGHVKGDGDAVPGWQVLREEQNPPALELSRSQADQHYRIRVVLDE